MHCLNFGSNKECKTSGLGTCEITKMRVFQACMKPSRSPANLKFMSD